MRQNECVQGEMGEELNEGQSSKCCDEWGYIWLVTGLKHNYRLGETGLKAAVRRKTWEC